jgi:hypothetical protein
MAAARTNSPHWADLLLAEHIALTTLANTGIAKSMQLELQSKKQLIERMA